MIKIDHIIKAMSHQKVTCLTLLDLSAAFDTIDHYILLLRLSSCIGISSIALSLSWIKSYFYVIIENSKSYVFQRCYGIALGSVVSALLFILYTTPLSTVISNSAVYHHLHMLMILNFSHQLWITRITSLT